jgi:hypothetical protein
MPPRYAYWTILIDGQATAFRARERDELLPTFNQLARKNANIVMRYFARGRLWDNPEQAQWESRNRPAARTEPRDRDWRPGGQHKDPRARFEKKPAREGAGKPLEQRGQHKDPRARFEKRPEREGAGKARWAGKPERRPRFEERSEKLEQRGPRQPQRERPKWFGKPKWQGRREEQGKPESGDRRPDRKFDSRDGKRPGRWNRPPKRKPR